MHLPNFIIHYLGILNEQFFDLIDQHLRIGVAAAALCQIRSAAAFAIGKSADFGYDFAALDALANNFVGSSCDHLKTIVVLIDNEDKAAVQLVLDAVGVVLQVAGIRIQRQ